MPEDESEVANGPVMGLEKSPLPPSTSPLSEQGARQAVQEKSSAVYLT